MVTGRLVIPKEGRHACLRTDRPHILGAAEAPCAVSLIDRSFPDRAAATQRFRQERWGSGHRVQLSKGGAGGRQVAKRYFGSQFTAVAEKLDHVRTSRTGASSLNCQSHGRFYMSVTTFIGHT